MSEFFKSVKEEYSQIKFPTREKVISDSVFVLVSSIIIGAIIALLDFGFMAALNQILK